MTDKDPTLSNPAAVAEQGEKIYKEKYKAEFEAKYPSWFVLIDVKTGKAYFAERAETAVREAQQKAPQGLFHFIRVGEPGAFRVSYRRHANTTSARDENWHHAS